MTFDPLDLWYASPLVAVTLAGIAVLIVEGIRRNNAAASRIVSLAGLLTAGVCTVLTYGSNQPGFNGTFLHGTYGSFFTMLFLAAGFLTVVVSRQYLSRLAINRSEYYALILFAITGMILMASAVDLVIIFLGLELMSLCLYVLAGFDRTRGRSNEAALKYFLLGAFVTGFLLYGIALVYGVTGTTNLVTIGANFSTYSSNGVFLLGVGLFAMSFSFKVAAAPFHMWAPDVYEGAPTTVTAFMSTAAKAAAFAAFMAVFLRSFAFAGTNVNVVLGWLAASSMVVGNITAIAQTNVKRLLAYSSIAHAGYMLTGIAAGNHEGQVGILFYLAAYVVMNIGAFTVISLLEKEDGTGLTLADYAGLSVQQPVLAALLSVFLFSLAGIPPLAGFFGKYYVFLAAVKAGMTWLAIVGVLTSLISVYYYLNLVVLMYFKEGRGEVAAKPAKVTLIAVGIAALLVLGFGLYPSSVLSFAQRVF
jgi:NADH-quinone oxidoreductase subunit N